MKTDKVKVKHYQSVQKKSFGPGKGLQPFQAEASLQMTNLGEAFQGFSPFPVEGLQPFQAEAALQMTNLGIAFQGFSPLV